MPPNYRELLVAVVQAQRDIARGGTYVAYMQAIAAAEIALSRERDRDAGDKQPVLALDCGVKQ